MPQSHDDLTPDEEEIRRLLADARLTEPMPTDVVARLDGVLADLHAEDPARPTQRPVDLAVVRRRRNARVWLVAAAAVIAVGVGINQLDLTSGSTSDDSGGSAGSAASALQGESSKDEAGGDQGDGPARASGIVVPLDSDRFGAQVRRLGADADAELRPTASGAASDRYQTLAGTCRSDARSEDWGDGRLVSVTYDGAPAVLVFRVAKGETQVVDLFLCGQEQAERSITLPVG